MLHLGWFVGRGYSVHAWNQPWSGSIGSDWASGELLTDLARAMDRACFDYLMIEDGSFVTDAYRGSSEWHLRNAATVPKLDPMPLIPLLGHATSRLGLVPTVTTGFYPPYLAARLAVTLDHLTGGRVGLNLVTAHNDRTAQNFGLDRHYEHDLRYEMADEWIEVVNRLWESWEPGAVVADPETGAFADNLKVHPIEFEGRYYRSRGPLNAPAGPQGRPVICQAGGSPAGIAFAAKHADTIVARARGIDGAKAYRSEVIARMAECGRRNGATRKDDPVNPRESGTAVSPALPSRSAARALTPLRARAARVRRSRSIFRHPSSRRLRQIALPRCSSNPPTLVNKSIRRFAMRTSN